MNQHTLSTGLLIIAAAMAMAVSIMIQFIVLKRNENRKSIFNLFELIMVAFCVSAITSMLWESSTDIRNPYVPVGYFAAWLLISIGRRLK